MACIKCGRELESEQVFCDDCLLDMKKYPVNPGTAVQLPIRKQAEAVRKNQPKRRTISPEEQIFRLRKRIRVLSGTLLVLLALLAAMVYPTVNYFLRKYHLRPGQNYTAITATTAPTIATEAIDPLPDFAD